MADDKIVPEGDVALAEEIEVREPSMYKVLLHNDDYTTMEFVVSVLEDIFQKNNEEATRIMLNVHEQGVGIAGIYTYEICETKISMVHELAEKHEFPLRCSMEAV
ncbi:MAG: ATP-dependent Clp protease adapter ClpS [Deltaproteobacteria bacterium]|nr:MAG: ATP-dependent Clp protease adapter ClpS [Deltaproteobacteria bacterium]